MMPGGKRLARVLRYYPGPNVCDLLFSTDGWRAPAVAIMLTAASTNTGRTVDIPQLLQLATETDYSPADGRVVVAVVDFIEGTPIITGFLAPVGWELQFDEPGRHVERFGSDLYVTSDNDGNLEIAHPSGTYLRIGVTTEHDDLTGKDFNKRWNIRKNTDKAVNFHVAVSNGGVNRASFTMSPEGEVSIVAQGDVTINAQGNIAINSDGAVSVHAGTTAVVDAQSVTLSTPTTHVTGDLNVDGIITAPTIKTTAGISLGTHRHAGVVPGGGTSATPVP